jgi:uncharacterized protein (DUF1330 family)
MKRKFALGLAMLIGCMLGAAGVSGLQAHKKPPNAYAIIEVNEITDPMSLEAVFHKTRELSETFGGQIVTEGHRMIGRDMMPPRRFAVIAFDSMEDAEAWSTSSAQGELDHLRDQGAKGRSFLVDGMP